MTSLAGQSIVGPDNGVCIKSVYAAEMGLFLVPITAHMRLFLNEMTYASINYARHDWMSCGFVRRLIHHPPD
jgi:hypothetical protein